MCGICGISSAKHDLENSLKIASAVDVLAREKNRGDDSYGLVFDTKKELFRVRGLGEIPLEKVQKSIKDKDIASNLVIGHVRAATVGATTVENAHPFLNEKQDLALAHNGHVYEWEKIKEKLEKDNKHKFSSQVDSEALVHVFESNWDGKETIASFRKATEKTFGDVKGTLNVVMAIPNMSKTGGYLVAYSEGSVAFQKKDGFVLVASVPLTKYGEAEKEGWQYLPSGSWMLVKDGEVLAEEKLITITPTNYSRVMGGGACFPYSEYDDYDEYAMYGEMGTIPRAHQTLLGSRSTEDRCKLCDSNLRESALGLKKCTECKFWFCAGDPGHFTWHIHPDPKKAKSKKVTCPDSRNTHEVWVDKTIECGLCNLPYCKGHIWDHPCYVMVKKAKKLAKIQESLKVCPVGQHLNETGRWTQCSGCNKWYCGDHMVSHDCHIKFGNKLVDPEVKGLGVCFIDKGTYVQTYYCPVCNNSFCPMHYNNIEQHIGNLHKKPVALEAE
jgi:predicted glutamine amidotransferase